MKRILIFFIAMLPLCSVQAADFRLEIAYFDPAGGPLTETEQSEIPIADGCRVELLLDVADDGIAAPLGDGSPGDGDAIYRVHDFLTRKQVSALTVNGSDRLRTNGFFICRPTVASNELPDHSVFIRVWNAPDPAHASGCWDSPLYRVHPGFQQVSFLRPQWTFYAKQTSGKDPRIEIAGQSADDPLAVRDDVFTASPNPFNSSSQISFVVKEAGVVRLRLYDLQGRLSATLVDGAMASGVHRAMLDGSHLATGLYFLALEQPNAAPKIQKLVLMR